MKFNEIVTLTVLISSMVILFTAVGVALWIDGNPTKRKGKK